ncbi:MAG TPA: ABC transporter permease [Candidatus Acidoferrales bacterium]|jgi:putative ABC transport system permease protein|nr:ABC transporter permease [Candidatus Acidoferrales bacterium]
MGTVIQSLRYGARTLTKSPGLTLAIVLSLAIGIGANTAIFSLVSAALFRSLPYQRADRLAYIWQNNRRTGETEGHVSYPNWADWRDQSHTFDDMAFFFPGMTIFGRNGQPERLRTAVVSTNFFSVMGVSPFLGRVFERDDQIPGRTHIAVIGYSLWQSQFGSDPHIVGRIISLGAENRLVTGVMPSGFSFPEQSEVWIPKEVNEFLKTKARQYQNFEVIGRLSRGSSWAQAQAEMVTIAKRLADEYPQFDSGMEARIVPLREQLTHEIRRGLLLLWGAISAVLLIACLNVANVMVARAVGRQKEISIRLSLGATRGRIAAEFFAESLVLACAGAALGLLFAFWIVIFVSRMNPEIAKLGGSILDARVAGYTVASIAITALICGFLPLIVASRVDLGRSLSEMGSGSTAPQTDKIRRVLIVAEIACTFVLLVYSTLLLRSLQNVLSVNPGFDTAHVLRFHVFWPHGVPGSQEEKARNMVYKDLIARLQSLPGVIGVGAASNVLFPGDMYKNAVVIEDQPESAGPKSHVIEGEATPDFFRAMGIPLLRGRAFATPDGDEKALPVAVINETMARRYWTDRDPIGKRFHFADPNFKQPWFTIVGIVGDIHDEGLEMEPEPEAYLPSAGYWNDDLAIRTANDPELLAAAVRAEVHALDRNLVVDDMRTVSVVLAAHEQQRRFNTLLLGGFALVALILAAIGIYGGISFWVEQRTHEIGIRMALGAWRKSIFVLVVGRGMSLAVTGLLFGFAGALAVSRVTTSLLFGITSTDPGALLEAGILLASVSFLACYLPARRAMSVDPMVALRHQ